MREIMAFKSAVPFWKIAAPLCVNWVAFCEDYVKCGVCVNEVKNKTVQFRHQFWFKIKGLYRLYRFAIRSTTRACVCADEASFLTFRYNRYNLPISRTFSVPRGRVRYEL